MHIALRTVKIVAATCIAILIAEQLGLLYASSAGIIALLSILDTRRSTLQIALKRVGATILCLGLSLLVISLLHVSWLSYGVFLAIFVPLAYRFHLQAGIAPCAVLATHLWLEQSIAFSLIQNELLLMLIGAGIASLFNLYMPSRQGEITLLKVEVEDQLKSVLLYFNQFLLDGKAESGPEMLAALKKSIATAKEIVYLERDNQVFSQTNYDVHYFDMRQEQTLILETMMGHLNYIHLETEESKILAGMFFLTADQLCEWNPVTYLITDLNLMLDGFRDRDLPKTRDEFENRATLLLLLYDFIRFLTIKEEFYREYSDLLGE